MLRPNNFAGLYLHGFGGREHSNQVVMTRDRSQLMLSTVQTATATYAAAPRGLWRRARWYLRQWRQNLYSRKQLARLDGRLLADAGISEAQRQMELAKPFWR
jgi:uncharacterized protein YjiS (DUF1127 family)